MKKHRNKILLWAVLAVAAVMRLYNFDGWSLSNDELSALSRLRFDDLGMLIENGVKPDMHPAGVQVFLYGWTGLLGNSATVVRLPFVLAGVASVYLVFLLGKRMFSRSAGLTAAAFLAVLEYPVMYSQLARPYSIGLFTVLVAAWGWSGIFRDRFRSSRTVSRPRWTDYALFILGVSASMYTHYFAMLTAGLICLAGLWIAPRERMKGYLLCGLVIVLLYLPHLGVLSHQLGTGGLGGDGGWLGPPDPSFFGNYLGYAFNGSFLIGGLALLLAAMALVNVFVLEKTGRRSLILAAWFLVPVLAGYAYSVWVNPVLQYSVVLFGFGFALLFICSFLRLPRKALQVLVILILAAGCYSTAVSNKYYSTQHFAVFRELAEETLRYNSEYGSHRITRTANVHAPYYLDYYFIRAGEPVPFELYKCNEYGMIRNLADAVNRSTTPYLMHAWSNIYDLPETEAVIRAKFPFIVSRASHFNSGITLYGKDSLHQGPVLVAYDATLPLGDTTGNGTLVNVEFSPGFDLRGNALHGESPLKVFVSARFRSDAPLRAKLVFSVDSASENISWYGRRIGDFQSTTDEWHRAHAVVTLDRPLPDHAVVKAFVWNDRQEVFYMDDFRLLIFKDY